MKFVALLSGGKDSVFNMALSIAYGHELVCIGNLYPKGQNSEKDSFMYQTVGVEIVPAIA
jgi:diphthine-ammonia ligase